MSNPENMIECEEGKLSLVSEKIIEVFNFKPSDVNAWEIAWGLSHANRYNGQTPVPWDVLSHTGMCYALYMADHKDNPDPATALAILLHDAVEAYLGDIIHPIKMIPAMAWYVELEDSIQQTIFERFGLNWQTIDWQTIKHYDYLSVTHEIHWLKPTTNQDPFFRKIDVPVTRYMTLGKARPIELVKLLKAGAMHFGADNIDDLFRLPKILEAYVTVEPEAIKTDDTSIPAPRSSADVDSMRV